LLNATYFSPDYELDEPATGMTMLGPGGVPVSSAHGAGVFSSTENIVDDLSHEPKIPSPKVRQSL